MGQTQQILYSLCAADITGRGSARECGVKDLQCTESAPPTLDSRDLATFLGGQATHAQPVAPGASTLCPFRKIDKIRLLGFTTLHDTRRATYAIPQRYLCDVFLRPPSLSYFDLVPGKVRPTVLMLIPVPLSRSCEGLHSRRRNYAPATRRVCGSAHYILGLSAPSLRHGLSRFGPGERGLQRILRRAQIGEIGLRALHCSW